MKQGPWSILRCTRLVALSAIGLWSSTMAAPAPTPSPLRLVDSTTGYSVNSAIITQTPLGGRQFDVRVISHEYRPFRDLITLDDTQPYSIRILLDPVAE